MKIAVFSNNSYLQANSKLGLQYIAEELSKRGHEIIYFGCPTHLLDCLSPSRKQMWWRAWSPNTESSTEFEPNFREIFLKAPWTRRKFYWISPNQNKWYSCLESKRLESLKVDLTISDTAISFLMESRVNAKHRILRLNDNPDAFTNFIHPMVSQALKTRIQKFYYDIIFPTNKNLAEWANKLNNNTPTKIFPNGVDLSAFTPRRIPLKAKNKKAIYIGRFNSWFDFDLLKQTAKEKTDWEIHLYGQKSKKLDSIENENIVYQGPVAPKKIPNLLNRYHIGLIPFIGKDRLMNTLAPLKLNQYLAANLPVASTSRFGVPKDKALPFFVGSNRMAFKEAMENAYESSQKINFTTQVQEYLTPICWEKIITEIENEITGIDGAQK